MPEISLPTKLTQDQIKTIVDQILVQVNQKNTSKTKRSLTFTTNSTWNVPSGVTEIYVTGGGGGGSGSAGANGATGTKGIDGSDTVLTNGSNVLTIKGGKGGEVATPSIGSSTFSGGSPGGDGGQAGETSKPSLGSQVMGGDGGNSGPYYGGRYSSFAGSSPYKNGNYCSGGSGAQAVATTVFSNGGGGAEYIYNRRFQVTPLSALSIVIGKGGPSVTSGGYTSGSGGDGIVTIEWWE